jgi:hypothetical protein
MLRSNVVQSQGAHKLSTEPRPYVDQVILNTGRIKSSGSLKLSADNKYKRCPDDFVAAQLRGGNILWANPPHLIGGRYAGSLLTCGGTGCC